MLKISFKHQLKLVKPRSIVSWGNSTLGFWPHVRLTQVMWESIMAREIVLWVYLLTLLGYHECVAFS